MKQRTVLLQYNEEMKYQALIRAKLFEYLYYLCAIRDQRCESS